MRTARLRIFSLNALIFLNFLIVVTLSQAAQAQTTVEVVDIDSRPGVVQRFLLIVPPQPVAALVLMSGGNGVLGIGTDGSLASGRGNFLVRSRDLFAGQGFVVAIPDRPSDRTSGDGMTGEFRAGPQHAQDLGAVVNRLRERTNLPVWLVGTSMGTISAANGAARLDGSARPDGIVLTSSITRSSKRVDSIPQSVRTKDIKGPVLLVHHEHDQCVLCPFSWANGLLDSLSAAHPRQLIAVSAGESSMSGKDPDPCGPWSHHGYLGAEPEVVGMIGDWVKETIAAGSSR